MITALEILFIGMGIVIGLWIAWKMAVDYFVPRRRRPLAAAQSGAAPVVATAVSAETSAAGHAPPDDPVRAAAAAAGVKSVLSSVPERKPVWKRL